jgi:hypothetical protein
VKSSSDHGRALDFGLSFSTKNRKGVSRQTATRNVATNLGMQFKEEIPMKKLFLVLAVLAMSFAPAMAAAQNLHPAGDKPMTQTPVPAVNGTVPNLISVIPVVKGPIPSISGVIPSLQGSVPSVTGGLPGISNAAAGPIPSISSQIPSVTGSVPSVNSDHVWNPYCALKCYVHPTDVCCRQQ